jgi:chromosome segregation ATPase
MSVVPFSASPDSEAEAPAQTDAVDARQRMQTVKHTLENVSGEIDSIQRTLASQQELEQLLKQGRAHLQDLRGRLQQALADREAVQAQLAESTKASQLAIEGLERELDDTRAELRSAVGERNRLTTQLEEQETAHRQFAEERADERNTFKRLLDEASFTQTEMTAQIAEQRQQIETLREAAMRAQSFAREIMRAHEAPDEPARETKA